MIRDWYPELIPRRFNSHYTVQRVGHYPHKVDWVDNRFDSTTFSFIMSGKGEYHLNGIMYDVIAPCVITQWTRQDFRYGPYEEWDELFINFADEDRTGLIQRGLLNLERPVWPLSDPAAIQAGLDRLIVLLDSTDDQDVGDRIDLLAESIVMESLIGTAAPETRREQKLAREAVRQMAGDLSQAFDFNEFAHAHGVHPATLRRYWDKLFKQPPHQYLMALRMRRARHLLVETNVPVKEVGFETGFANPLYFSRYFKKRVGVSPRAYREASRTE